MERRYCVGEAVEFRNYKLRPDKKQIREVSCFEVELQDVMSQNRHTAWELQGDSEPCPPGWLA